MAELNGNLDAKQADQALSPEERRIFPQVFSTVDNEGLGVITGDVAIKFLPEKTKLPSEILGEIWQVADPEDKSFVTKAGFFLILRLIGYAQSGRALSPELALRPGPLPRLEGVYAPSLPPLQAQGSGGPIPIPKLLPEKASQYATLFEQSGAQDGVLDGTVAKQIFDRAQLPNDVLIRIWNLADTEQRGKLSVTEFIIAMHLLASFRSGAMRALPNNLPAGLYEAAARRGAPARSPQGSRSDFPVASALPRSFTGQSATARTSSPLARQQYSASPGPIQAQITGATSDWAIPALEKASYDQEFARLDMANAGFITGEQAVGFFGRSKLPEDDLAQIWDLSDVTKNGQLSQDEFAVAMHLIRLQFNGRGPLPATLPANLIPPSLRRPVATTQAKAPVPVQEPPKSKSALDDLFGLDVAPVSKQIPQSTGGSAVPAPVPAAVTKNVSPQPTGASHFKPFVPSSSFGQSIVAPQTTGSSFVPKQASFDDDLLGDADPAESQRFTQDTTDMANLTNQVTTLTTQTNDLQTKKAAVEQELNQSAAQKRDMETRLAQLRASYEQEARSLKALQDRLNTSKTETARLQQDIAMVQHSFQLQQEQKQQVQVALEADQKENASLKEQIAEVSRETNQIQPQIEKMKADAQQQKALVAVHQQQLSTLRAEREKAQNELNGATIEYHSATQELEESQQSLKSRHEVSKHEASRNIEPQHTVLPAAAMVGGAAAAASIAAVASPALSTSSMNPFFRRAQSTSSPSGVAPAASTTAATTNHSAFDSFFDNDFSVPTEAQSQGPAETTASPVPRETTPVLRDEEPLQAEPRMPSMSQQPPPPPRSRQMTPSILPLRNDTPRAPSVDSSLGVVAPDSLYDDTSEPRTPTKERALSRDGPQHESPAAQQDDFISHNNPTSMISNPAPEILSPEPKSAFKPVPGAFPLDSPVEVSSFPPNEIDTAKDLSNETPTNTTTTSRSAFDALFGSFGSSNTEGKGKAPVSDTAFGKNQDVQASEFPPIQEFGQDDEESSDEEIEPNHSPEHNLTSQTGISKGLVPLQGDSIAANPTLIRAPSSEPPAANAQQSPPTYMDTISPQSSAPRSANQFAAEYTGLLPAREDPRSLSMDENTLDGMTREAPIQTTSVTAVEQPPPFNHIQATSTAQSSLPTQITPHDEFEDAFGDLSETKAADTVGEDDFNSSYREGFDDFNPTFDSPAPSKATTFDTNAFHDIEAPFTAPTNSTSIPGSTPQPTTSKNDWDALFAGFGTDTTLPQANGPSTHATVGKANGFADAFDVAPATTTSTSQNRQVAGGVTPGTEHDDPILKHLTAMGYARDVSVVALEKFDYNLDKAANYLASHS